MTDHPKELLALLAQNSGPALRSAGYTARDLRNAGYIASDVLSAGYTASDVRSAGYEMPPDDEIPLVHMPYTRMLADIKSSLRKHDQSTFGPDYDPATNLCGTAMCTAGHIVQMAGPAGYALKNRFGFDVAAFLLFERAHPGWPQQNYGIIPQEWAMAHIEVMAEREAAEAQETTAPVKE